VTEPLPPWAQPDLLPEKPQGDSYGYVLRNVATSCSRETLIERCQIWTAPQTTLVWAPEADRLVPAMELPILQDALRERERQNIHRNLRIAAFSLFVYSVPTLLSDGGRAFEMQLFLLLSFGVLPLADGWWELRRLRDETAETLAGKIASARYSLWMSAQRRGLTHTLLAILVFVFVLQMTGGLRESIQRAGLTKTGLHSHDAYRFLTATLMHGGVMHLLMNGLALFFLGIALEALIGSAGLSLLFTASALGGSALSFVCSAQTTVGASGGIMGLLGCLVVFGFRYRKILPPKSGSQMIYAVFLTALTGFVARHVIDNAAHAGGLLTGVAVGWLLARNRNTLPLRPSPLAQWAGHFSLSLLLAAALFIGFLLFYA